MAREDAARPSLPRSGAAAVRLPNGDVLMFGGYTEDGSGTKREASNESWVYSTNDENWRAVLVPAGSPAPRPRLLTGISATPSGVWVVGGWDPGHAQDGGTILDDVWRFDLLTHAWTEMQVQGERLPTVSRHQACAVGHDIYIHTHRSVEDILVLDTAAQPPRLRKVPVLPDAEHGSPQSRGLHSLTPVSRKLFLIGGAPQRGPMLGDLWVLDTSQQPLRWRKIEPQGPVPPPRCSHAAAAVGQGGVLVVGGSFYRPDGGGLQGLGDAWLLDTATEEWRELPVQGAVPRARNAAVLVALTPATASASTLLYHGGWEAFQQTYNDTFLLNLTMD